jgi:hypothetical protein
MKKYLLILLAFFSTNAFAQSIGIGTTTPDASALLDIRSNGKGVLVPRMSIDRRNAILNPAKGLLLFVVDDSSYYFNAGTPTTPEWQKLLTGNNVWNTTGNAGANPATNFIGTTDNNDIVLKRNNINAGRIGNNNTRIGTNTLSAETGFNNTIVGSNAGNNLLNGIANTAVGFNALKNNTTLGNTAIGAEALSNITTGTFNIGVGFNAQVPDPAGHNQLSISNAIYGTDISAASTAKIGIGTSTPTSKLNVNGQVTIDQKNFGGIGGLLIKGNEPGSNNPNIAFSIQNDAATPVDEVAAMIQGDLIKNAAGSEAIDLTFSNSLTGLSGLTEKMRIKANGNVGIGMINPTYKLHIGNFNAGVRIEGPTEFLTGGSALSIGRSGNISIDKSGVAGGRFLIKENGNVGIGNNNPNVPLSFAPDFGRKISLYQGASGDAGFAVRQNLLQIYSDNSNSDVAIGYDDAGSFNEKLAVKANGALRVNGNTGLQGQVLTSNGDGTEAVWKDVNVSGVGGSPGSPGQILTSNGAGSTPTWQTNHRKSYFMPQVTFTIPSNFNTPIPGAAFTVNNSVPGKVVIWLDTRTSLVCGDLLLNACHFVWQLKTYMQGTEQRTAFIQATTLLTQPDYDHTIGPIVIDVLPGNHNFTFNEALISVVALPTIRVSAYAEFIPN